MSDRTTARHTTWTALGAGIGVAAAGGVGAVAGAVLGLIASVVTRRR